jgi:ribonucleoside-diphosphate reductase alpha subunit
MLNSLNILKRSGTVEPLDIKQIDDRVSQIVTENDLFANEIIPRSTILSNIFMEIYNKLLTINVKVVPTSVIDQITEEVCMDHSMFLIDAKQLAKYIHMDNIHKQRRKTLTLEDYVKGIEANYNPYTDQTFSKLNPRIIERLKDSIDIIDHDLDFNIPIEGMYTLEKQYLLKRMKKVSTHIEYEVFELPSELFFRLAVSLCNDVSDSRQQVIINYFYLGNCIITSASPVLSRAGTIVDSMASCYLTYICNDSIESIYESLKICAMNSGGGGGIGISFDLVRESNGFLLSMAGRSKGVPQFAKLFEYTSLLADQGSRRGSSAAYLQLWHLDIQEFINMRGENLSGTIKCPELFIGVFIDDLFMRRAILDKTWSLFSPNIAQELVNLHGEEFRDAYERLEQQYIDNVTVKKVPAFELLKQLLNTKIMTGQPYFIAKDYVHAFSNMHHMLSRGGQICMNLCTEICLYVGPGESAVCILSALNLTKFVHHDPHRDNLNDSFNTPRRSSVYRCEPVIRDWKVPILLQRYHPDLVNNASNPDWIVRGRFGNYFNFWELATAAYQACIILNNTIDNNKFPTESARICSLRDRPIGIGQQGLFDVFILMGWPAESIEVRTLNVRISATIYFFALLASADLARDNGRTHESYPGSAFSRGLFQFDLRNRYKESLTSNPLKCDTKPVKPCECVPGVVDPWNCLLRPYILEHGMYNSELTSIQPTESSAKINRVCEMTEPPRGAEYAARNEQQNVKIRIPYITPFAISHNLNIVKINEFLTANATLQGCPDMPTPMQHLFRGVYEYDPITLIDLAADRENYIDMAQSFNIYMNTNTDQDLYKYTIYAYRKMLKTLSYYVRLNVSGTVKVVGAITNIERQLAPTCSRDDPECLQCSS